MSHSKKNLMVFCLIALLFIFTNCAQVITGTAAKVATVSQESQPPTAVLMVERLLLGYSP